MSFFFVKVLLNGGCSYSTACGCAGYSIVCGLRNVAYTLIVDRLGTIEEK